MGTILFQVTETGFPNASKSYTLPDAQIDRVVAAYQNAANLSVNGTATRAQVLGFLASSWMAGTVQYVQSIETQNVVTTAVAAVTPITPA